jgi:hypothetical protein
MGIEFFVDNFFNSSITNEKFVVAMTIMGIILIYFGKVKRKRYLNDI